MKKLLISVLLSSLLLADCTFNEEQRANKLWLESRGMQQSIEKYQKLQQAKKLCNFSEIQIDTNLFLIANELGDNNLHITKIRKFEKDLSRLRSENNTLSNKATIQQENAQYISELTDRLVEIQIGTNQGKLEKLEAYNADDGNEKGFGEGEIILVPIRFANGKDRVQGNKNIDSLVRKIKHTLTNNKNATFTITGYASSLGKAKANLKLSERRAINTMKYIENYIPKGKIKTFRMGESDLICNNGYAKNMGGDEYKCKGGSENEASSRRVEVLRRD
ncbi:MAG TPA: OmpA family protein [Campylobacterales bacterium]|nr:OmpA family protein [Campylobacterales bacterium]